MAESNGRLNRPEIKAAVFDFDYTLADSSEGCVDCVNFAFQEMGLATHSADIICRTIGLSLKETFVSLAGDQEAARGDEFVRLFVQRADQVMVDFTVMYKSVAVTIPALRESGLRLGIVSTKYRYRIEQVLERENLRQFFEVVIGGEHVEQHKPHQQDYQMAPGAAGRVAANSNAAETYSPTRTWGISPAHDGD